MTNVKPIRDPRMDIASDWYKTEFNKFNHYFTKAVNDVVYPITKADMLKQVGDREFICDYGKTAKVSQFIEPIKIDNFESAAEFYNAMSAVL